MTTLAKFDNIAGVVNEVQLFGFLRMATADNMVPLCVARMSAYPAFSQLVRVA